MYLGIDITTHTARAAYLDAEGRPRCLRLANGSQTLPAIARQTMHGLVIGPAAARSQVGNAETSLPGCTRLMGRAGDMPPHFLARLPYAVREVDGEAICNLLYAEVRSSEVYGRLVKTLVDQAEQTLDQPVTGVVLTIPAGAEDRFRVQARQAVERQGLRVRRLINQPTAALLAASLPPSARRVAVIHCGGGSTAVSLAERRDEAIHIRATAGNMLLGGDDLAWAVAERLNERFRHTAGIDVFGVGQSSIAAQGLRHAAEQLLRQLALRPETTLVLDHGGGFGRDLMTIVRRPELDGWLAPSMTQISDLCHQALNAAHLTRQEIDAVLLTGDWAFLPTLQETAALAFGRTVADLHTAEASLLPVYGAALAGTDDGRSVWDVTPYPLGINCYYGDTELFSPIITANTPIPTPPVGDRRAFIGQYQTRYPNQTKVTLDILQYRGLNDPTPEGPTPVEPAACELLGRWEFSGLRPKKGQHAAFTVTFAVDADGILQLYARETRTGHHLAAQVERGIG